MTTATAQIIQPDILNNRLQQALALWYSAFWILTGISPVDRRDWLLENFLVVLSAVILIVTYRRVPLSPVLFVLVAVFISPPSLRGAYTYAQERFGGWVGRKSGVVGKRGDM